MFTYLLTYLQKASFFFFFFLFFSNSSRLLDKGDGLTGFVNSLNFCFKVSQLRVVLLKIDVTQWLAK